MPLIYGGMMSPRFTEVGDPTTIQPARVDGCGDNLHCISTPYDQFKVSSETFDPPSRFDLCVWYGGDGEWNPRPHVVTIDGFQAGRFNHLRDALLAASIYLNNDRKGL